VLTLRPYQEDALTAIFRAYARGISRPLIALPTGTGKTVIFSHLVKQRPGRCLILVHRDELIRQAYDKLQEILPEVTVGVVKAQEDDHIAPIVIASVQTLGRATRLDRMTWDFATVIVDEAHHAIASTYRRILDRAGSFRTGGPLTLGVTATPMRGDRVGLDHIFQKIVYRKTLLEMIMAGYLADLRAIQIELHVDFRQLRTRAGDFVDADVANMLVQMHAPEHILAAYQDHAASRKTLLFTPTVHLAELMAELFNGAGIPTESVSAETPLDDRRALLHRFHTGVTRVVTNCGVLTEGYDEPSVDCVIVARPTQSAPLFTQMVGRGTRLYPGKADCLVLDVVGATTHHHLASVATLTGLPVHALHTRTVREVQEALEQVEERKPISVQRTAHTVDLFRQRPLHWLKVDACFSLSLGDHGWIMLSPEGTGTTHWHATIMSHTGEITALASGYSLAYIQGIAEDHARKVGAGGLTNPKAYWRQHPASDKQLTVLRYLRIPHALPLTMGEASDMITQAKMREAVMRAAARGVRA
jgi:superfamily II DNA or RNA helicase